ncbi:Predicted ester cyclase [Microbacterium sp. cf046]|uniref:ester cyclase n=1 Tax=Microbacterium sp. cf046 TaxID=1761803 RepID=UPI0008EEDFC6|nr:ester cyclase [Microbacterium sp. cf046]SFR93032.1 Predicted ester cyclase [Microbacterium sp. cf046]
MPAPTRETFVRDYIEAVFNRHELDDLESYWLENLTSHWMGQQTLRGLDAWRSGMTDFFAAFPEIRYTLDDLFFSNDRAVWRGRWRGVQRGDWAGIAASGKEVEWTVIIIARFADGKFAEDWVEYDRYGLYRQLGVIPLTS